MSENIHAVEQNIDALEPSGFYEKHNVVLRIADVDEVPYTNFLELRNDLLVSRAIVRLAPSTGISSGVFSLFASSYQKRFITFLMVSAFAGPILGIGLIIFGGSWWWLLLVLAPFLTIRRVKNIHSEALFDAVGSSEKAFCFAFCGDVITLETPDGKIRSRGREPL